ncbi:hypothetical protein [Streptococcus merionis]|uniref:Uncharacterized protein n=1 Tax=Streptococcus merionis TaxID=400065 RepID=A0A239SV07_9STRE|nr:hypothetical protein [Streptococcus merionis]SNU89099.1 Uncharacterised protein [Streptococcus merionis]
MFKDYQQLYRGVTAYFKTYIILLLLLIAILLAFERGWGLFVVLWLTVPHLPFILLAWLFAFFAYKSANRVIWLLSLVCLFLSMAWWLFYGLEVQSWSYAIGVPFVIFPIVATI